MIPLGVLAQRQAAGGGGAFSPADLNLLAWWDASDASTITSSGGVVSEWRDKSPSGLHVSATSGGPLTGSATIGGLNVLSFSSSSTPLTHPAANALAWKALHDGTDVLYAVVFAKDGAGNHGLLTTRGDGSTANGLNPAGMWLYLNGSKYWVIVTKVAASTPIIASSENAGHLTTGTPLLSTVRTTVAAPDPIDRIAVYKNSSPAVYNATALGPVDPGAVGTTPLTIGSLMSTGTNYRMIGRIAEIIIVTGVDANETNRVLLREYLNAKWSIY